MPENPKQNAFLEFANGAMMERVDYALKEIFNNICDPNTPPDKVRKLNLSVTFKPSADRAQIAFDTVVKTNLQPTHAITGSMAVVADADTGEVALVEMVPQVPGQMAIEGTEQQNPKVLRFPA